MIVICYTRKEIEEMSDKEIDHMNYHMPKVVQWFYSDAESLFKLRVSHIDIQESNFD